MVIQMARPMPALRNAHLLPTWRNACKRTTLCPQKSKVTGYMDWRRSIVYGYDRIWYNSGRVFSAERRTILYQELTERFVSLLQLPQAPVGLAFVEQVPEGIEHKATHVPSACTDRKSVV